MTPRLTLIPTVGVLAILLTACDPASPADPAPVTPPETTGTGIETADVSPTLGTAFGDDPEVRAAEAPAACDTIGAGGYCGIEYGMTAEEAEAAYQGGALYGAEAANEFCYYLQTRKGSYDRALMVNMGKIERVDIKDPTLTLNGVGIATPLDDVEDAFDTTSRSPNKYLENAQDLRVDLGDGVHAVFQEGTDGDVRAWRIGIEPAISFVEGCA